MYPYTLRFFLRSRFAIPEISVPGYMEPAISNHEPANFSLLKSEKILITFLIFSLNNFR